MTGQIHELSLDGFNDVVRAVGSKVKLAELMGISRSALYDYISRRRITPARCVQMEAISGVPRERIMPNLFSVDRAA